MSNHIYVEFSVKCTKSLLGNEIASKLSAAFAKTTGIDVEFAVQLLKDHGWNVDQALRATYEAKEHAQTMINTK